MGSIRPVLSSMSVVAVGFCTADWSSEAYGSNSAAKVLLGPVQSMGPVKQLRFRWVLSSMGSVVAVGFCAAENKWVVGAGVSVPAASVPSRSCVGVLKNKGLVSVEATHGYNQYIIKQCMVGIKIVL